MYRWYGNHTEIFRGIFVECVSLRNYTYGSFKLYEHSILFPFTSAKDSIKNHNKIMI